MKPFTCPIFYLLSMLFLANACFAQDSTKVITDWLTKQAMPIQYIEPGNNFSDLQSLKQTWKDVRVIGLGEATHGTREFFQMKHRLVEFLVREMNFTAFALESSYSNCQPINDYILTGKGDRATVLTGQGYMPWDTEEFAAMLDWMKAYNQSVAEEKKVKFYGIDVRSYQQVGREKILDYIQKYASQKATATKALFDVLAEEENKWPTRLNQSVLASTFMPVEELNNYFITNKNKLVAASSLKEWEHTYKYLEVIRQGLYINVKDTPAALVAQKLSLGEYMAQNLFYILERERPGTKFIVWQQNWHISVRPEDKTLGHHLRQRLGDKYYALGFKCYEGTFQARELLSDGTWGDLKADTILPFQKSLGWYLSQTSKKNLLLNLRNSVPNPIVAKWLETPIRYGNGDWIHRKASENFGTRQIKDLYDGILFIERSTPVHPTKNAIERSKNRIGF